MLSTRLLFFLSAVMVFIVAIYNHRRRKGRLPPGPPGNFDESVP